MFGLIRAMVVLTFACAAILFAMPGSAEAGGRRGDQVFVVQAAADDHCDDRSDQVFRVESRNVRARRGRDVDIEVRSFRGRGGRGFQSRSFSFSRRR